MKKINILEKEINKIKERNARVEAEKAWETSWTRIIIIAVLTYMGIVVFFYFAHLPNPFMNAFVPALAFILSTFSLSLVKKIWLKSRK